MTSLEALNAKIAAMTVALLKEVSLKLNLAVDEDSIFVLARVEAELSKRVSDAEFAAHMEACEAMLDAAA